MSSETSQLRITITKVELIRLLAKRIRKLTAQYEKEKRAYPEKLARLKQIAEKEAQLRWRSIKDASGARIIQAVRNFDANWYKIENQIISPPSLNVCYEKNLIEKLRMGEKEKISLRESDPLWTLIKEDACKIIRDDD